MKKLLLLGGALCLALASLAEDKMKLDLPIVNDPARSSLYFNGSGTARIDSDGQPRTAAIDLDFEHPA